MNGPPVAAERQRLDVLVWQRKLASSRARARALILAGKVAVDGQCVTQCGARIADQADVKLLAAASSYVSRGGDKLAAGLEAFDCRVRDAIALDIGASTGGFTDCLLQAGARRVYAVDVGYGQLHWQLRNDPRVVVRERTNARHLTPDDFPERMSFLTADASFISLRLLLPALVPLLTRQAEAILLIKPQFEVGKGEVGKGGVVRDSNQAAQPGLADSSGDSPVLRSWAARRHSFPFDRPQGKPRIPRPLDCRLGAHVTRGIGGVVHLGCGRLTAHPCRSRATRSA